MHLIKLNAAEAFWISLYYTIDRQQLPPLITNNENQHIGDGARNLMQ
jgi:hypothetical protein